MLAPSLPVNIELHERTDAYVIAVWRRLFLLVWRGEGSATGIERSRQLFDEWATTQPLGAAFLIVFTHKHPMPPDGKTREAMERTARSPSGRLKGMATLFEAEGFIAASIRSVMMRLSALGGQNAPNTFGTAASAAAWASGLLADPEVTGARLTEAIRLARER